MIKKVTLYYNTVKHLKGSQVYYRVINRGKRELYKKNISFQGNSNIFNVQEQSMFLIPELDFNKEYLSRFEVKEILNNTFTFINIKNKVALNIAWNDSELQHLWRYNLHYFDYLYALSYEYAIDNSQNEPLLKIKSLIEDWINHNPFAKGDGWHPYTISLRLTNWISVYCFLKDEKAIDQEFKRKFLESTYRQYQFLQRNLEKDVLGNHYFENIKALLIGSIFFKDNKVKEKFKKELLEQLDEQILEDGMHFELSPMYHKIVLEDLIKISYWLREEDIYTELITYIQKMIDVTCSLEKDFGKTPAFNDSADGISKNYENLLETCTKHFKLVPKNDKTVFDKSGYYIVKDKDKKMIFDAGCICPTYLPAHGHCDALSFELSISGSPVVVNSGTYQYESGEWRNFFRKTKAHNTVTVSDQEQSQFWGSFRIAKRIKNVRRKKFTYKGINFYSGFYNSYHGAAHKRFIGYIDENKIIVLDHVTSDFSNRIKSYLHLVPEASLCLKNEVAYISINKKEMKLTPIGISEIKCESGWYSEQFNLKVENKHLTFEADKTKEFSGYLLEFNNHESEVTESSNGVKLIDKKEVYIDYRELGDML